MAEYTDPVLAKARELGLVVPVVERLHSKILKALENGGRLDMFGWHGEGPRGLHGDADPNFCGTTHCRAGWTTHLAGSAGAALENAVAPPRVFVTLRQAGALHADHGDVALAAELIIRASCPWALGADFVASEDAALQDIKRCAELEPAPMMGEEPAS